MNRWIIALLISSLVMGMASFVYALCLPRLTNRYRPKGLYVIGLFFVLGLLIPTRPILPNQQLLKPDAPVLLPFREERMTATLKEGSKGEISSFPVSQSPGAKTLDPLQSSVSVQNNLPLSPIPPPPKSENPFSLWDFLAALPLWQVLFGCWLAGVIFALGYHLFHHWRFVKQINRWKTPITDTALLALYGHLQKNMELNHSISLYLCPVLATPMLTGLVKPAVLIPNDRLPQKELNHILSHELTHFKRRDLWSNAAMVLVACVHWFNPLVYLFTKKMVLLGEMACDAQTLQGLSFEERSHYCHTISKSARSQKGLKTAFATPLLGGKKNMKQRVVNILDMKYKKIGFTLLALVLAFTLCGGLFLPYGYASDTKDELGFTPAQWEQIEASPNYGCTYANGAFYSICADGRLVAWKPGNQHLQVIGQVPTFTYTNLDHELPREKWSAQRREYQENSLSHLVWGDDGLWGYNEYSQKIGPVDEKGLHWLPITLDKELTDPNNDGSYFFMQGGMVHQNTLYTYMDEDSAAYNYNAPEALVLAFDLLTGKGTTFNAPGILNLTPYKEDQALLMREEDKTLRFSTFDYATGQIQDLPMEVIYETTSGDQHNIGDVAYDAKNDILYYVSAGILYQSKQGGAFTPLRTLPLEHTMFGNGWVMADGRYAVSLNSQILVCDTSGTTPAPGEKGTLRISTPSSATAYQNFMLTHPGVAVKTDSFTRPDFKDIVTALSTGDDTIDIYRVSIDSSFKSLLDKGYAASLGDSAILTDYVNNLYPYIKDGVTNSQGLPMALPEVGNVGYNRWEINQPLWEEAFGSRPIPATYEELIEAYILWEKELKKDHPDIRFDDYTLFTYEGVITSIMDSYIAGYAPKDAPLVLSSATLLRQTLTKSEELAPHLPALTSDWVDDGSESSPLFLQGTSFLYDKDEVLPSYFSILTPMDFPAFEAGKPIAYSPVEIGAWFINPHSKQKDLAIEYLELLAQGTDRSTATILSTTANQPIEKWGYQAEITEINEYITYLKEELTTVTDPAQKLTIQEDITNYTNKLESTKAARWSVSPAAIANYQALAPNISFYLDNPYISQNTNNVQSQLKDLYKQYAAGALTLDAFLREVDNVLYIVFME